MFKLAGIQSTLVKLLELMVPRSNLGIYLNKSSSVLSEGYGRFWFTGQSWGSWKRIYYIEKIYIILRFPDFFCIRTFSSIYYNSFLKTFEEIIFLQFLPN